MKIVQFSNGKYGVRTYWFFGWYFIDTKPVCNTLCRPIGDDYFYHCQVDTIGEAGDLARRFKEKAYKIVESV